MSDITAERDNDMVILKRDGETVHIIPADLYDDLRHWSPTKNRMDITEFVNEGYLQEVNRQVLHPLGLALEVICDDKTDHVYRFGGVHDCRNEPEGMAFGDSTLDVSKVLRVAEHVQARRPNRERGRGYWIQPCPDKDTP